ncbi:FNDC7 protein, partial [Polyodon spathula]|nr:FNDC7 protein [Polyodon spathula]
SAAPCTPQDVNSVLHCSNNVVVVSWGHSDGAVNYTATVEGADGNTTYCTTRETACEISGLQCGEIYIVTVISEGLSCNSTQSAESIFKTEPCIPDHVQAEYSSSVALVSWDPSDGANSYIATAQSIHGDLSTCNTAGTSCTVTELHCGLVYNISITPYNDICNNTNTSAVTQLETAPCTPQNVTVELDCEGNSALVSWDHSNGAVSYTVRAESSSSTLSCSAHDTQCFLTDLTCGLQYSVHVVAVNGSCSSQPSEPTSIQAAPCTPQITEACLDCFTNTLLMQWTYSEGATTYIATAESKDKDTALCNSTHTNCEILDLDCGQLYSVTVVALSDHCNSSQSISQDIESVPCVPQSVDAELDCTSNIALVLWEPSSGAQSYIVNAVSTDGHIASCNTSKTTCQVTDLMCGNTYNISVTAINQQCNVSHSTPAEIQSVPCVPKYVGAHVDCETGIVSVSWEDSKGAVSYTATAQGSGGYSSSCNTTHTTCELSDLLCGHGYSLTVTAADDTCTSIESSSCSFNTVPCIPQHVSAHLECANNTGSVSWEPSEGANYYSVMAMGVDGHVASCNTSLTNCELEDLHCGQMYNFTVTVLDGECDSIQTSSDLQAAPCPPKNVRTSLQCDSNIASVSWEKSAGAVSYSVIGQVSDGHIASCNTTETFCDLAELHCGQMYSVSVFALDDTCNSIQSMSAEFKTGPCPPQHLGINMYCDSGIMFVSWDAVPSANSYTAQVAASDGNVFSCDTDDTNCFMTELLCGTTYTVTVTSFNGECIGAPSEASAISSAPCTPKNLNGYLDCVTNAAWLEWDPSKGAELYTVTAVSLRELQSFCTTANTTCHIPDLQCGIKYSFTVIAFNKDCTSLESNTIYIETAPCTLHNLTAETQCNSNILKVMWDHTESSRMYIATAEGSDGNMHSCNSSEASCDLTNVHCGVIYTIIIASSSDKCSSQRSPPYKIQTAPCAPQEIAVSLDCNSHAVTVHWSPSFGTKFYLLTATGSNGSKVLCNSSHPNCTLQDLQCGQLYTVSVTAGDETCMSHASKEITFNTVPCVPDNLTVQMQCATNSALLSWDQSNRSLEYFVSAIASDGEKLSCSSQEPGCTIDGLTCGTKYNFTVTASNGVCYSSFGVPVIAGAVPCPPQSVALSLLLLADAVQEAKVWWSAVQCVGVEYLVEMRGLIEDDPQAQFILTSHWTTATYFFIPVPCSSTYNVTVTSRSSAGIGYPSLPIQGLAVPCPPKGVTFYTEGTSWNISWNASVHATEYVVYSSKAQRTELCRTSHCSCTVPKKQNDTVEVTAVNSAGESEPSVEILV